MTITEYAKTFIGTKYTWGGESADEGFDCSGFVQECLRSQGLDPKGDQTAQMLYDHFTETAPSYTPAIPSAGCLLFFGVSKWIQAQ